jgi:hypothetical protein
VPAKNGSGRRICFHRSPGKASPENPSLNAHDLKVKNLPYIHLHRRRMVLRISAFHSTLFNGEVKGANPFLIFYILLMVFLN